MVMSRWLTSTDPSSYTPHPARSLSLSLPACPGRRRRGMYEGEGGALGSQQESVFNSRAISGRRSGSVRRCRQRGRASRVGLAWSGGGGSWHSPALLRRCHARRPLRRHIRTSIPRPSFFFLPACYCSAAAACSSLMAIKGDPLPPPRGHVLSFPVLPDKKIIWLRLQTPADAGTRWEERKCTA